MPCNDDLQGGLESGSTTVSSAQIAIRCEMMPSYVSFCWKISLLSLYSVSDGPFVQQWKSFLIFAIPTRL